MELHCEWLLILSPIIAAAIYPVSNVVQTFKWFFNIRRMKPFDCTKCLSFWICLLQGIYIGVSPHILLPFSLTSMFIGFLITKYITKL